MKLTFTKKPINDKNIWWITSSLANLFDGLVGILTLGYFHSNLSNITVFWHLEKQGKIGCKRFNRKLNFLPDDEENLEN